MPMITGQTADAAPSAAMQLLLLCSLRELTAQHKESVLALLPRIGQWDEVLQLSQKNRVYPMLYHNLRLLGAPGVDPVFMQALQAICAKNQLTALKFTTELIRLSQLFAGLGIRLISIKGPMLGLALYGDVSLRVSKDLDLLIDPLQLDQAVQALKAAGYQLLEGVDALTPRQRSVLLRATQHFSFFNGEGVSVELHWRLHAAPRQFSFEELWRRSGQQTAFGGSVRVLDAVHNFLYLVYHGSKHGWNRLRWLCDANEIISGGKLDWGAARALARQYGLTCHVGQTLLLTQRLFGTPPPYVLGSERRSAQILARDAQMFLLNPYEHAKPTQKNLLHHYRNYLWAWNHGIKAKLRYFRSRFDPDIAMFQTIRLREPFFWLYYLVRPFARMKTLLRTAAEGRANENDT